MDEQNDTDELADLERARHFIEWAEWTFAKTMPEIPHWYEVRQRFGDDVEFDWFVQHIREHGYRARFWNADYTYLTIGEWKYWTMGRPVEQTIIVNRERLKP